MLRLLGFFALGALLLVGKRALETRERERPALQVEVAATASEDEVARAIDEMLLVEEALRQGSPVHDPVVRSHLLTAVLPVARAAGESDEALLRRALDLGMHRADPVVRNRLAFQGEQLLLAREVIAPTEHELQSYYLRELSRYREAARISLVQLTFSRARRAERARQEAERAAERIAREGLSDERARELSDPTLLPHSLEAATESALDGRFGSGFWAKVAALEVGRWSAPIPSSYGYHLVRLREVIAARTPPLAEVEARVRADYASDARRGKLRAALERLRAASDIRVIRGEP